MNLANCAHPPGHFSVVFNFDVLSTDICRTNSRELLSPLLALNWTTYSYGKVDSTLQSFARSDTDIVPPQSRSGATIAPECVSKYNELKLKKDIKYIIYKLSDDYKEIVVEDYSSDKDWETFQNKLLNAKAGYKGKEGKGPRYAVYDFQWELASGEGTRNKIVFISWSPDEGTLVFPRMTYASSKEALKNALPGIGGEVQANRDDEIEYDTIFKDVSKGAR